MLTNRFYGRLFAVIAVLYFVAVGVGVVVAAWYKSQAHSSTSPFLNIRRHRVVVILFIVSQPTLKKSEITIQKYQKNTKNLNKTQKKIEKLLKTEYNQC